MADKLKIYACSGIDDEQKPGQLKFWTDGSDVLTNTQAANGILTEINLLRSELRNLPLSEEERIERYNAIDIYTVCLYFVNQWADDEGKMYRVGFAIGELINQKAFDNTTLSIREREDAINNIIARINEMLESQNHFKKNEAFSEWWNENVMARLKVGLDDKKRKELENAFATAVKGLGKVDEAWKGDAKLSDYLLNGSEYFLYLYFTPQQLAELPRVFRVKAEKQKATYNDCKAQFVGVYGSERDMQNIIRAGIQDYFHATPEAVCDRIAAGEDVGDLGISEICAIIAAVAAAIVSIIKAIMEGIANIKQIEWKAYMGEDIEDSTPAKDDVTNSKLKLKSNSSWITFAALAIGAVLLLKNSK
ncbi:MAG: hypothetical protein J5659_03355 [Clostridia bacterium]|nr:hypothetical protein [Clostridia bacterium]